MLAEIVTIGDELCRGEIVDTNSGWLAERLWELDISAAWLTSCRDDQGDIRRAIETAAGRCDLVLCSGGLGPTVDDLTVDVVSALVGAEPVVDPGARELMVARYAAAGREVHPLSERQVRIPGGARVHTNPVGLAPGFEVEVAGVPVVCMPGIPRELKGIWGAGLGDRVADLRDRRGVRVYAATEVFRAFGRGESDIAARLGGLVDPIEGASIHFRVPFPEILIKLVVRDADPAAAAARLAAAGTELRERLGWIVYGTGQDSLSAATGRALREAGLTCACAESCTGGLLGARLTDVAGSSDYFAGGAITYSNAEKVRQLGVAEATLVEHGAVSEACVVEMARGIRERTGADLAVAISGIAGPGGGSEDKPVGTVWLALDGPAPRTRRFVWPGRRDQVRALAAHWGMSMLLREAREVRGCP
jgi:nicotinamide-nucleotide amidase